MSNDGPEPALGEEEDVFLDATETPEAQQTQPLWRSTRKRKSIDIEVDATTTPKHTGKRHRPLGKMGGIHRSPDASKTTGTKDRPPLNKQGRPNTSKPDLTVSIDPPTENPNNEQLILLGGIREVLKEELKATENRLVGRISVVEGNLGQIQGDFRELEKRLSCVENRMDNSLPSRNPEEAHTMDLSTGPGRVESPVTKLARYWKSRKSLRMWPIKGQGDQLRMELQKFLSVKLGLGEDVLTDTAECSIRRIPTGRKKNNRIEHEVLVEFPTVDLRDVVRGAAYNLADHPDSGILLEIAHHLMANFKALSNASYRLKQKYPACKRNIKYDDECADLVLDFKVGQSSNWKKLRPSQARELVREEAGGAEEVSASDLTELLEAGVGEERDGGGADGEDEDESDTQ